MTPRSRTRILWTMSALVVVYALLNVIVYFASGTFGTGWFVASLVLYGLVLAGALFLLARDENATQGMPTVAVQVVNNGGNGPSVHSEALVESPSGPLVERGSPGDVGRAR